MADRSIDQPLSSIHAWPKKQIPEDLMRRGALAFVVTLVLGVSGIATAGVLTAARHHAAEGTEQDAGVHGGPIERFQNAASCDLTAVAPLPGNWTHGDYVSAVAASGDPTQIQAAAHSDCGKPMVSVGHGGGPPDHALEQKAAGQAHAGGQADDADPSGS